MSFLMIAAELFKNRNFVSLQKIQILCREVKSNNNNNNKSNNKLITFGQLAGGYKKANNIESTEVQTLGTIRIQL